MIALFIFLFLPEHLVDSAVDTPSTSWTSLWPEDLCRSSCCQSEGNFSRIPTPDAFLRLHGLPFDPLGRCRDVREADPFRPRSLLHTLFISQRILVQGNLVLI